jgi:hypothetical protein
MATCRIMHASPIDVMSTGSSDIPKNTVAREHMCTGPQLLPWTLHLELPTRPMRSLHSIVIFVGCRKKLNTHLEDIDRRDT